MVVDGRLQLRWTYSTNLHSRESVVSLAERYLSFLRMLVAHCLQPGVGGFTPSDFPLARLDQPTLEGLGLDRSVEDVYPLTALQQGLLFHSLADPGRGTYMQQLSFRLAGGDAGALAHAWQVVADRHAILRTAIVWEHGGEPLQVVRRGVRVPVEVLDWRDLSAEALDERFAAALSEDLAREFDLRVAPLLRVLLVRAPPASPRDADLPPRAGGRMEPVERAG